MSEAAKQQKQIIIDEIKAKLDGAQSAVLIDYMGTTVDEANAMRKSLREEGIDYSVYKNTLMKRAVEGTEFEALAEAMKGPSAIAISKTDATAPARVLKKNMEEYAEQMADSQVNDSLLEALVAQCEEVEISDEMMNAEIESAVARISQQMAQQGIPMEAYLQFYGKTMEEFRQDLRPQAENSLKARLALEEVARLEGITVTDEELEAEVELMAREFGISAEQLKTLMGEGIALENLRKDTVVKKTVKVLLDSAVITVEQM